MGTVPIGTLESRDDRLPGRVQIASGGEIHHRVGPPALRPAELLDLGGGSARDRRGTHVGVHLGPGGPADADGTEAVLEVNPVGGDHHPPGCHLVADLLDRQVGLSLGRAAHLGRDASQPCGLELGDRFEALRGNASPVLERPARGEEIPGGLSRGLGHPGGVRGAVGPGTADISRVGEAPRRRAFTARRGITAEGRKLEAGISLRGLGHGRRSFGIARGAGDGSEKLAPPGLSFARTNEIRFEGCDLRLGLCRATPRLRSSLERSSFPGWPTKSRRISRFRAVRYASPAMMSRWIVSLLLPLALAGGCHRNVEPFDPDEQVVEPDLSAIFPEGAERSNAAARGCAPARCRWRGVARRR